MPFEKLQGVGHGQGRAFHIILFTFIDIEAFHTHLLAFLALLLLVFLFANKEEMAKAILFGVAQKIIENLGSQIFQEIGSLWGVKDELQNIKSAVSRIQAVLLDATEQQSHNHQDRDWLRKLKDVVYDANDLLGEFFTEALRRRAMSGNKIKKEVRTFFSSSNQVAFRIEMSGKIKAMRKKLDAIAKENRDFNLKVVRDIY